MGRPPDHEVDAGGSSTIGMWGNPLERIPRRVGPVSSCLQLHVKGTSGLDTPSRKGEPTMQLRKEVIRVNPRAVKFRSWDGGMDSRPVDDLC